MTVQVQANAKVMLKRLKKIQGTIKNPEPILEALGDVFRRSIVQRFWKQRGPTGRPWKKSKAARKARRRTLVRTGDLRDSMRVVVSGDRLEIGTDIWYGRIHQVGGPIDAEYRRKSGKTTAPKLPSLPTAFPTASSAEAIAKAALRLRTVRKRQSRARRVLLPARRFLGVSRRDRKNTLAIMIAAIEKAMK